MDVGSTLDELIEGVQLEVGHSTAPGVGQNFRETIAAAIRKEYRRLHADFDWPHLLEWGTANVAAGAKLIDLPDGVELAQLSGIYHKLPNGFWRPVQRTLNVLDYNEVDSDAGARRDPVCKWRAVGEQVEIWPLPTTAGQLRFVYKSKRAPLAVAADTCDLDEELVVLFASANLLFRAGKDHAGLVLQRGRNRYETLRQRLQTGANRLSLR
jgi:hypothetical protein